MRDRAAPDLALCVFPGEVGFRVGDFQLHFLADEFETGIAHQHARQQPCLAENLETVADAENAHALVRRLHDGGHDVAAGRDGARAQIVAIGEAAAQHYQVELWQFRIGMPDGLRFRTRDVFERVEHIALAVRAGKDDDARLHAHFSSSSTA